MTKVKKEKKGKKTSQITVGIPRAFLFYRYGVLWRTFLSNLGVNYILSETTTRAIMDKGSEYAIDEMCLPTKVYLGHVDSLIGKCDYILVPRISNFGVTRWMCQKFEGLYDMTCNVFRNTNQKFISYNVAGTHDISEKDAFIKMGKELGFDKDDAEGAYKDAKKQEKAIWKDRIKQQEKLLETKGTKVLMVAHPYVIDDMYIGKPILDCLDSMNCTVIRADVLDKSWAYKRSKEISPTLHWEISREFIAGIDLYKKDVDGIINISAFPCNPDSMVDEMIVRKYPDLPILNMTIDSQTGMAGIETRLESFIDIIHFKKGAL